MFETRSSNRPKLSVLRWLAALTCATMFMVATATPALADFGYAGGADPGVALDVGAGNYIVTLPALTNDTSPTCFLVVTHLRAGTVITPAVDFPAATTTAADIDTYITGLGTATVLGGDQITFELTGCDDVPADLDAASSTVIAIAKRIPVSDSGFAGSLAVPGIALAAMAASLFGVRRYAGRTS